MVTITAAQVVPGMQILVTTGPGSEFWPMVREVVVNDDGTRDFDVHMMGMIVGYRDDEMVVVEV